MQDHRPVTGSSDTGPNGSDRGGGRYGALGFREFRLLCGGQFAADIAINVQLFAVNWHVFELLHGSSYTVSLVGFEFAFNGAAAGLGGIGLVRLLPTLVFGALGGLCADAYDRRGLMLWTRLGGAAVVLWLFLADAFGTVGVGLLYLISALTAALHAFDTPARQALVPSSVPARQLSHAISLFNLTWRISAVISPLLAAALIARFSLTSAYAVVVAGFSAPVWCLAVMRLTQAEDAPRAKPVMAAFLEGFAFVRGHKVLWASFLADFIAACFTSISVLLPILAEVVFDAGVGGYGFLAAGQPVGACVTGLALAYWHRLKKQGPVMVACLAVYGLSAALVGMSHSIYLSFALLTLLGAADTTSTMIRSLMRQTITPDALRGRVLSIAMLFFRGGPRLGEMQAGLLAALVGAPLALVVGGAATMLGVAAVIWRLPQILRYDGFDPEAPAGKGGG
jgi:MFS family permease